MPEIQDKTVQNLLVLAAHTLGNRPFTGEAMQMAELWADVAAAQKYLADKKAEAGKPPAQP